MTILILRKKMLDKPSLLCHTIGMIKIENLTPLSNFQVVAVHRKTGKPQFATITAPSQVDADDFVADMASDWIVIRDNKDLLDDSN